MTTPQLIASQKIAAVMAATTVGTSLAEVNQVPTWIDMFPTWFALPTGIAGFILTLVLIWANTTRVLRERAADKAAAAEEKRKEAEHAQRLLANDLELEILRHERQKQIQESLARIERGEEERRTDLLNRDTVVNFD